jgi:5-methylcytosine-specific restriction protein A
MRRNFSKATQVARFKQCGGRCEGTLANGKRCNALLMPGCFQADHDNPDGLTGEPTFENCRMLCSRCHAEKTLKDVAAIAKAKRLEARHIGVEIPKKKITSPPKLDKPKPDKLDMPPRRPLFVKVAAELVLALEKARKNGAGK